jgi:hypothetical protein
MIRDKQGKLVESPTEKQSKPIGKQKNFIKENINRAASRNASHTRKSSISSPQGAFIL